MTLVTHVDTNPIHWHILCSIYNCTFNYAAHFIKSTPEQWMHLYCPTWCYLLQGCSTNSEHRTKQHATVHACSHKMLITASKYSVPNGTIVHVKLSENLTANTTDAQFMTCLAKVACQLKTELYHTILHVNWIHLKCTMTKRTLLTVLSDKRGQSLAIFLPWKRTTTLFLVRTRVMVPMPSSLCCTRPPIRGRSSSPPITLSTAKVGPYTLASSNN